jgi:flagellar hook-length control protein FliK
MIPALLPQPTVSAPQGGATVSPATSTPDGRQAVGFMELLSVLTGAMAAPATQAGALPVVEPPSLTEPKSAGASDEETSSASEGLANNPAALQLLLAAMALPQASPAAPGDGADTGACERGSASVEPATTADPGTAATGADVLAASHAPTDGTASMPPPPPGNGASGSGLAHPRDQSSPAATWRAQEPSSEVAAAGQTALAPPIQMGGTIQTIAGRDSTSSGSPGEIDGQGEPRAAVEEMRDASPDLGASTTTLRISEGSPGAGTVARAAASQPGIGVTGSIQTEQIGHVPGSGEGVSRLVAGSEGEMLTVAALSRRPQGALALSSTQEQAKGVLDSPAVGPGALASIVPAQGSLPNHDSSREGEDRRLPREVIPPDAPRGTERAEGAAARYEAPPARVMDDPTPARESMTQLGVDRVVGATRLSLNRGGMEVSVRLHPESLGEVRVQVRWEGGALSARLEAATPAAKDALEAGAHTLQGALREQGIPVERFSVGIRMDLETRSQPQDAGPRAERGPLPDRPPAPTGGSWEESRAEPPPSGRLDVRI